MVFLIEYIFNFFCRFTSYGIGVALSSAMSSVLALTFGLYYANAINIPTGMPEIRNTIAISLVITWIMHATQFGLWSSLGFRGFTRSVRSVNRLIAVKPLPHIRDDLTPHEYKELLKALIVLPVNNTVTGLFYVAVLALTLLIVSFYYAGFDTKSIINGGIMFLIIGVIHGVISFILGELATGKMRSECKRIMSEKGIEFQDRALSTVRLKFFFFLIIFVVALYISNTLTYFNRDNTDAVWFSIFAVVVAMFMAYLVFQLIFSSLKEIETAVEELKKGGEGLLFPRSLDSEFVNLAVGVADAARKIKDYQGNLELKVEERTQELQKVNATLQKKDAEIQMELDFAAEIQKGIVPVGLQEWNGLKIASYWNAMEVVSGDYFDLYAIQGGKLGIVMADVSGHGVPAALITTMAKVAFGQAGINTSSPAEIFSQVNDQLVNLITTQDYLTAFFLAIDENHRFTYANASHQFALLVRAETGEIEALDTDGLFIGALEEASDSYADGENYLKPGDRLVLYTDGIVERKNVDGEDYGQARLEAMVKEHKGEQVEMMVEKIMADFGAFAKGSPQTDDVSLLVIGAEKSYDDFLTIVKEAFAKLREGKSRIASRKFDEALKLYDRNLQVLRAAALVQYELGNYTKAAAYMHDYNAIDDQDAEIYFWLSAIEIKNKNYTEALKASEKAIALKEDYFEAYNNQGIVLGKLQRFAEAKKAFENALRGDEDNREIRANLEKVKSKI